MDKVRIHAEACDILRTIADIPIGSLRIDEALFLFRHCLRDEKGSFNIIAGFSEEHLEMLMGIAQDIIARGSQTIH